MAKNFPVYLDDEEGEVTVISGTSIGTHGGDYNLARGYLQVIEFITKCTDQHAK